MSVGTVEERSRVLVARCRQLADKATDPEAAEALRETAFELEVLLSILYDEQRRAAKEGGEG